MDAPEIARQTEAGFAPLISIVVPAYKAAEYLRETLESIATQDYTAWELLVVEDGSDDGTRALVEGFTQGRPQRVRYLRHTQNQGLPATRNTGIRAASGEWVAFLDSDDLWEKDHLSRLVKTAHSSGADLVHSGVVMFLSSTRETIAFREPDAEAIAALPLSIFDSRYPIQPSSSMVRHSLLMSTGGFDISFKYVEDREYWIRLLRAGARIAFSPARTCLYRQHEKAMTNNAERMSLGIAMVQDKHGDWDQIPRALRARLASKAWLAAGRIVLRSKPALAKDYFARAIRWDKTMLSTYPYWCCASILSLGKDRTNT